MRLTVVAAVCLSMVGLAAAADAQAAAIKMPTNIPAQGLGPALKTLAKDRGFQVVFRSEVVGSARTQGAAGNLTTPEALTKLLEGTNLSFSYLDENTVTIISRESLGADPPRSDQTASNPEPSANKEVGKRTSQDFRLAQVDQEAAGPSKIEKKKEESKKTPGLEEIVVTGSRIPTQSGNAAHDIKVYDSKKIEQSGQSTVADFLNTVPSVSLSVTEGGAQTYAGTTTVQLRGLPFGTTLVLLNGRRTGTSGLDRGFDFFDLNTIPLAAVDRIEIEADGASAVYGSDAIAGVVNIILKKDFDGIEANARYGGAVGTDNWDSSLAWGKKWEKASFSIIGSYQSNSGLDTSQRSITASNNYKAYGGPNANLSECNPGTVFSVGGGNLPGLSAPYAAVPAGFTGTPTIQEFQGTAGTLNQCSVLAERSLIPVSHRTGVLMQGAYDVSEYLEVFTELMYSHVEVDTSNGHLGLFGVPGFQSFTVSSSNPFNPFGTTVGIADSFTSIPYVTVTNTQFYRAIVGAKGSFLNTWNWEISAARTSDSTNNPIQNGILNNIGVQNALNSSNPATALNPFVAGVQGSQQFLQSFFTDALTKYSSVRESVNGFARGSLFDLPAGPVQLVFGGEYDHDSISTDDIFDQGGAPPNRTDWHRDNYALFAETRVPVLARRSNINRGDLLDFTFAGRHDQYSDFGGATTGQGGAELRPSDSLLIRGTYGQAFKAPPLFDLHFPQQTFPNTPILDPLTGNYDLVTETTGGNPNLRPLTGDTYTVGIVWSSQSVPDLRLAITDWNVREVNAIQIVPASVLVKFPALFPGDVIRPSSCPGGPPCPISQITNIYVNFGSIKVGGVDLELTYKYPTRFGDWKPSLSVSETYEYLAALTPGTPPVSGLSKAQDTGLWAPRWKGTAAVGWDRGPFHANIDGRYTGSYRDYDSTREIGNFWLVDATFRYNIGTAYAPDNRWLRGAYGEIGGVNLFNKLPQYSNYLSSFIGYDPTQADIRGRFLYVRVGVKF